MLLQTAVYLFVLTGGPGAGKTSLIEELKARGYRCIEESGRKIILEQLESDGAALPWKNKELFRNLMFSRDLALYKQASKDSQVTFFDRGFVDNIGYSKLENLHVPQEMDLAARHLRYNTIVFMTPPWEEIYCNDSERKQSLEESIATYNAVKETYLKYGYEILEIPKTDLKSRADFVLAEVKKALKNN